MTAKRSTLLLAVSSVLLAACTPFLESRQASLSMPATGEPGCILRALDGVFGTGATRANAQAERFVIAAFPLEGYVTTSRKPDGVLEVHIELTHVSRYRDGDSSLSGLIEHATQVLMRDCGS